MTKVLRYAHESLLSKVVFMPPSPHYSWGSPKGGAVTETRCFMEVVRVMKNHKNCVSLMFSLEIFFLSKCKPLKITVFFLVGGGEVERRPSIYSHLCPCPSICPRLEVSHHYSIEVTDGQLNLGEGTLK